MSIDWKTADVITIAGKTLACQRECSDNATIDINAIHLMKTYVYSIYRTNNNKNLTLTTHAPHFLVV